MTVHDFQGEKIHTVCGFDATANFRGLVVGEKLFTDQEKFPANGVAWLVVVEVILLKVTVVIQIESATTEPLKASTRNLFVDPFANPVMVTDVAVEPSVPSSTACEPFHW